MQPAETAEAVDTADTAEAANGRRTRGDSSRAIESGVEAVVARLLGATETLHRLLAADRDEVETALDLDALGEAAAIRATAFAELEALHSPATWAPTPAVRSYLARIAELDREILALGESSVTSAQGARHAAQRKRAVMHAQHTRGRDEPRLITVKA